MAKKSTIGDVLDALQEAIEHAEDIEANNFSDKDGSKRAAVEAINQVRRGEYADAITTLEREFLPKWRDRDACNREYVVARLFP